MKKPTERQIPLEFPFSSFLLKVEGLRASGIGMTIGLAWALYDLSLGYPTGKLVFT
jgi:hypothetical protein